MLEDQTGFHLESKADAEDEGGDGRDEPREERIEGEGAHLVDSSLKLLGYSHTDSLRKKKSFVYIYPSQRQNLLPTLEILIQNF